MPWSCGVADAGGGWGSAAVAVGHHFDLVFAENGHALCRTGAALFARTGPDGDRKGHNQRSAAAWIGSRQIKLDTPRGSRPHRFDLDIKLLLLLQGRLMLRCDKGAEDELDRGCARAIRRPDEVGRRATAGHDHLMVRLRLD